MRKHALRRGGALALALSMVGAAVLTGCGSGGSSGTTKAEGDQSVSTAVADENGALDPVTLRIYFCGEKPAKADMVWQKIAETYKDKLNCDFEVNWISMGDYRDKIIAMASSGDDWDLNYDGLWQSYAQMVSKGAYLDVSELLPKYAPDLNAAYEQNGLIDAVKVDGKVYALPWNQPSNFRPWVMWRSDLTEKDGIQVENNSIQTIDQLDDLMHQLKEKHPSQTILALGTAEVNQAMRAMVLKDGLMWADFHTMYYDINDPSQKLLPMEQTQTFKDTCHLVRKWVDDGIVSQDDLQDKTTDGQRWLNGQAIVRIRNHEESMSKDTFNDPSWTHGYSEMYPDNKFYNRVPLGNAMCVNRNAKNPERALMFLNLLQSDRDFYNMVIYGIEGETYIRDGESVKFPEGESSSNSSYMNWMGQWALYKADYMLGTDIQPAGFWKEEAEYAEEPKNINNPVGALTIQINDIKNEIAVRDQLYEEYGKPLVFGLIPDDQIDAKIDEYIQKQKDAGLDKILEVAQKQIDDFLASNK